MNKTQMSHPSFILKVLVALAQALRSREPFKSTEFIHNRKGQRIARLVWTDKALGRFLMYTDDPRAEHSELMVSIIEDCGNTLHIQWLKELQAHATLKLKEQLRQEEVVEAHVENEARNALCQARRAVKFVSQNPHIGKTLKGREAACEALAWYRQAAELVNKRTDLGRLVESGDVEKFRRMGQVVGMTHITSTEIILSRSYVPPFEMDYTALELACLHMVLTTGYGHRTGPIEVSKTGTGRSTQA
jgi:hypothetical protein